MQEHTHWVPLGHLATEAQRGRLSPSHSAGERRTRVLNLELRSPHRMCTRVILDQSRVSVRVLGQPRALPCAEQATGTEEGAGWVLPESSSGPCLVPSRRPQVTAPTPAGRQEWRRRQAASHRP